MRNRSSPSAQSDWIFLHPNALWIRDWTNCGYPLATQQNKND
mgnify:CR=1 FL=1